MLYGELSRTGTQWMKSLKELSDGEEAMKEHGRFLKMNQDHLKLQLKTFFSKQRDKDIWAPWTSSTWNDAPSICGSRWMKNNGRPRFKAK